MRAEGIETVRRILCVFPRYTSSFGTFEYSYPLTDGVQAFMPPQGLLLIAAYMPENWPVRFIDENIDPATPEDFEWAEAVFVSGMHIQRHQMNDICRRAHGVGLAVAIGGPSVSACPDYYPSFDYLHVGELGDATNDLIARIARDPSRPEQQVVLKTADRLDMTKFPIPAYELADINRYFLGSIQYSSGCPYQCEFCDIPGLYGRNPRLKSPQQNTAERPEILAGMREAFFSTIFCGIETPDPVALKAMHKDHNMMVPIMEAIKTLNSFGMEVVSGIILGLDTDKPETGAHLLEFIEESQIPLLTINLLQALPKTPLWDRLKRENRLIEDEGRDSNVDFRLPYEDVVMTWRACMGSAYQPDKLLERYEYQIRETYPNQIKR